MKPVALAAVLLLACAPDAAAWGKERPRVVLVEAEGSEEGLSAFVARLESELSDRGKVVLSDARLSGATLGALASEPDGDRAKAFRSEWPGEAWLAVTLSPCRVEVSRMSYRDRTDEGYVVDRVVENVRVDCPASLRVVDAGTGRGAPPLSVTGTAGYRREGGEDEEGPELEATRDAAEKAAKKLPSVLKSAR